MQRGKSRSQKTHLRGRIGEVDVLGDTRRIGAMLHQAARQVKGVCIGGCIAERSGIGKHGRIETGGNLRRDLHSGSDSEAEDHLSGGAGAGVDPVHIGKRLGAVMVIDVDEEVLFQSLDAGALHAVTLQDDGSLVFTVDLQSMHDGVRKRERLIDHRNVIAHHDLSRFAHLLQNAGKSQQRANGVAIRTGVGGEHKFSALLNVM